MRTLSVEPARPGTPCLTVSGVTAGYGQVPVIHDVSVDVRLGEIVCVLGPNGAGKSTLLKALTGILPCIAGSVNLLGEDITGVRSDLIVRRGIGYVPQSRDVFGPLTVQENLEMGGYTQKKAVIAERIDEVLGLFPLLAPLRKRRASNLSGGERKLLALGKVLMTHPKMLILDEPTANLAPKVAHELLESHVRALAQHGTTVLFVEQRAVEALSISDWAYVMVSGALQLSSPASGVLGSEEVADLFLGAAIEPRA